MKYAWLLLVGVVVLTACGADTSPRVVSPVPTHTATAITAPSPTVVSVAQLPTIGPTTTPAPTSTRIQEVVNPDGPTATSPLRPTFTPAPPTLTVTALPTNIGLRIEYFTTTSQAIAPGDNVTLAWRTFGADSVRIYRLSPTGAREREWPVDAQGQLTVSTSAEIREEARFLMVVQAGNAFINEELAIAITCAEQWFFQPAPTGCATQLAQASIQVEQHFEGGLMIWVGTTKEIYVIFNDPTQQPRWQKYPDTYVEGTTPDRDDSIFAPEGRFQPVRGFGLVWRDNQRVRDRLGWATESESGYDGMIQASGGTQSTQLIYMRVRDGGIIGLQPNGTDWQYVTLEQP